MHRRRREVHAWMRVARSRQLTPTLEQRRRYAEDALDALQSSDPPKRLGEWADQVMTVLLGKPEDLKPLAEQIAAHVAPSVETVLSACAVAPPHLKPRADAIASYARGLVKDMDQSGLPAHEAALRRLLALEVVDSGARRGVHTRAAHRAHPGQR